MLLFTRWFFIVLSCVTLYADWDPEYCLPDHDISVLDNPIFKELKRNMVQHLAGTWCSKDKVHLLMDLICATKPEVCVEIGAFGGSSVLPMVGTLRYLQKGNITAIDAWSNSVAIENMDADDPNRAWWSVVDMEGMYRNFIHAIDVTSPDSRCRVLRMTSETASLFVGDDIDFLHLDGDYTEKGSLRDVHLYIPKVKKGGYILLSNLFVMVKNKAPKMKSFSELFDACEMLCEIDRDNVVLFRKN